MELFSKRVLTLSYSFLFLYFVALLIGSVHFWIGLVLFIAISVALFRVAKKMNLGWFYSVYSPISMMAAYLILSFFRLIHAAHGY